MTRVDLSSSLELVDLQAARRLAVAIAIGLLIGAERYKARDPGEVGPAGVRTFAAFALLGGICGLLDRVPLTVSVFAAIAAIVIIGYYRESRNKLGATTELACLLTFWLGYLVFEQEVLAISATIVLTILLATKQALHGFVRDTISERELIDTLKFLAVILVIYPLLPDHALGPFDFFNPRKVWWLVILVSTISYAGYILMRTLGKRRGLILSALAGGVISTTATTQFIAAKARQSPGSSPTLGPALILANSVQPLRLLLLVWVVDQDFARTLSVPFVAMAAIGLAISIVGLVGSHAIREGDPEFPQRNPYSLTSALKFGLFFTAVLFLLRAAEAWLGAQGLYLASALGGGASVSAVALTVAGLAKSSELAGGSGIVALLIAYGSNALVKYILARTQGTPRLARWLGGGLAAMLLTGLAVAFGLAI